ncbi:MAG TPA: hypothetical protein VG797_03200 [Phycisphaerales bacterium]|nr:hypothetical protein [Phycisphaerales bacterium]
MLRIQLVVIAMLGIAVALGASVLMAAPSTLQPPVGPVAGTGRTLNEIYDKVVAVEAAVSAIQAPSGGGSSSATWQYAYFEPTSNQSVPQLIVPGRVLVHAVVYYSMGVRAFDGSGGVQVVNLRSAVNGSSWAITSTRIEVDVVVENGLYASWNSVQAGSSNFTVLYRQLDP